MCRNRRLWVVIAALTLILMMVSGQSLAGTSAQPRPAGAEKTTITNWADPRPSSWLKKYPLFGPVALAT